MKFLSLIATLVSLAASQTFSNSTIIGPFDLVSTSSDPRYSNLAIYGRHVGAATNIVLLGARSSPSERSTYGALYLNASTTALPLTGRLTQPFPEQGFTLQGYIQYNTSSNIAPFYLGVSDPIYQFSFGGNGEFLLGGQDNWWVCENVETLYGPMMAVTWVLGGEGAQPDRGGCSKIGLRREGI